MSTRQQQRHSQRKHRGPSMTSTGKMAAGLAPLSMDEIKALSPDQMEERYRGFRGQPLSVGGQR